MHPAIPIPALTKYVDADPKGRWILLIGNVESKTDEGQDHSTSGVVDVSYGQSWVPDVGDTFEACEESELPMNKDVNSGDPIGMGMASICLYKGQRMTTASAYLAKRVLDLTVVPDTLVAKYFLRENEQ